MHDVSLLSLSLSSAGVTMKRWEIQLLMEKMKIPGQTPPLLRVGQALREASEATQYEYRSAGGRRQVRLSETGKDTDQALVRPVFSLSLTDPDSPPIRIGQLKLMLPTANARGIIPGSHDLRLTVASRQPKAEQDAASAWMDLLRRDFSAREATLPSITLRKMIRSCFLELDALPVPDRNGLYFIYADRLAKAADVDTLLQKITTGCSVLTWPLDPRPAAIADLVASVADQELLDALVVLENDIARHASLRSLSHQRRSLRVLLASFAKIRRGLALHEVRTGRTLPRAGAFVGSVESKLMSLAPHGSLPSVTH